MTTTTTMPCPRCRSTDVTLFESGYTTFNPGGGRCDSCGFECVGEAGTMPTTAKLAAIWNGSRTPAQTGALDLVLGELGTLAGTGLDLGDDTPEGFEDDVREELGKWAARPSLLTEALTAHTRHWEKT